MKKNKYSRMRKTSLVITALLAASIALWLAFRPGQQQRQNQRVQTALMDSIQQGEGVIELEDDSTDVDYYDEGAAAPPEEVALFMPATADSLAGSQNAITGIGILTIERLDIQMPVVEGVTSAQLKVAAGHVPDTAMPGETGNAVIAGHRSYTYGEHFNRLSEAEIGDVIQYQSIEGENMVFVVDEILEILPGDQSAFEQPEDTVMLTLYTCTPIRTATHRLLVRATRVQ